MLCISQKQANEHERTLRKRIDLFQEMVNPLVVEELSHCYQNNPVLTLQERWTAGDNLNTIKKILRMYR